MVIKKEKYTLCHFNNEEKVFGYIHKDVEEEQRLALRAVLKEQDVIDITDIWNLNFEKLKEAKDSYENETDSFIIKFDNFYLVIHKYYEKPSVSNRLSCYISKYTEPWIISSVDIAECDELSFFIEETVNNSKLFDEPLYFFRRKEQEQDLIYASGRIILQKKNFTVIKLGAHTDYVFSFGELVLINENGSITELYHNVSTTTSKHINEYKRMVGVL